MRRSTFVLGSFAFLIAAHGLAVSTDFGGNDSANAVVTQSDGKIVAAGDSGNQFGVARYLSTGFLDTKGFGNRTGKVTTSFGTGKSSASALSIQPDGKIVVVGSYNDGIRKRIAMARYSDKGILDISFDYDGKLTLALGPYSDEAGAVSILSDGTILIAGTIFNGVDNDYLIARFSGSGALLGSTSIPLGGDDTCSSLLALGDGRMVLAGTTFFSEIQTWQQCEFQFDAYWNFIYDEFGNPVVLCTTQSTTVTKNRFGIVRLNGDFTRDNTFGNGGIVIDEYGSAQGSRANALTLQDSKILVAGTMAGGEGTDWVIGRFHSDGALDTGFANWGWAKRTLGGWEEAYSIHTLSDRRFIVTGKSDNTFAAARFNPDTASFDTSFNVSGYAKVTPGVSNQAKSGAVGANGSVLVVGQSDGNFSVKRFSSNGAIDGF